MNKKIGVITIGQSPRPDLIPEIKSFFPTNVEIIQKGVLDNIDKKGLEQIKPDDGQTTLISRLKDGTSVTMAKEKIIPLLQHVIDDLNKNNVCIIIIACTGEFKSFRSKIPIIYPDYLLNHVVKGIFRDEKQIGVIIPLQEQEKSIKNKWKSMGLNAITVVSSPYLYKEESLIHAAKQLEKSNKINTIVLDCIGYTQQMKEFVMKHTSKNVILSRNIIFKTAAELF